MAKSKRWGNKLWILTLQCTMMLIGLQNHSCSAACGPPRVQCTVKTESCYLTNYRGEWEDQMPCNAAKAFFSKTESELIHAVAYAIKKVNKIKVITGSAHSLNHFACPSGNNDIVISTQDYNSLITVDERSIMVTVDAGVMVQNNVDILAAKGLAMPHTTD
ncbi:hypothetical protein SUGI_0710060 [Cryptomeria japonica]|nr:hypothetical protein SUGI_0710060 [Cryptomeria japonica]